jgi:hypothetical protein
MSNRQKFNVFVKEKGAKVVTQIITPTLMYKSSV